MKSLRYNNLHILFLSFPFLLVTTALLLQNCAATPSQLYDYRSEAEKKYPVPPEPEQTIDTAPPKMPEIPEPPPEAIDEQRETYQRRLAEAKAEHLRKKNHWMAAKNRIEAQYSAWEKDKAWALQKRKDYLRVRSEPIKDLNSIEGCIGATILVTLTGLLVALLVGDIELFPNFRI